MGGVYFLYADKHQSFYKLTLLFLIKAARNLQSTQKRTLVIFLQYFKKSVATSFVFCCDVKYLDICSY